MGNSNLTAARKAKNDEFYTMYADIEKEMVAYWNYNKDMFRDKVVLCPADDPEWSNFCKFFADVFDEWGLKKLICTSYAPKSNHDGLFYVGTDGELSSSLYDPVKSESHGRVLVLERSGLSSDGTFGREALEWSYLEGDGDFRSPEVTALRAEADFVISNPPFSLFREFIAWVVAGGEDLRFSLVGNMNAITYKEVFPLIKDDKMWLGPTISSGDREFRVPDNYELYAAGTRVDDEGNKFIRVKGVRWFTNIEHHRRHEWLDCDTMERNCTKRKAKAIIKERGYPKYDNYDAIEVSYTEAIPSDYTVEKTVTIDELDELRENGFMVEVLGVMRDDDTVQPVNEVVDGSMMVERRFLVRIMNPAMGVPISFLDKYNPEQFEILGLDSPDNQWIGHGPSCQGKVLYRRIFVRSRSIPPVVEG